MNPVVAGAGAFRRRTGDDIGHLLETTSVVGHEADAPFAWVIMATQNADLFDVGMCEKIAESGHVNERGVDDA